MSDQQATGIGVVLDLEELFLSREFGRRPARSVSNGPASVASQPAWLEQVFLSDTFGHPEVVAADARVVEESVPVVTGRPALVLLTGGAQGSTAAQPHHRALAAVSGVAAAALAVAGLASGTGQGPGRPPVTEQAQGSLPNQGAPGPGGVSQPGPTGTAVPPNPGIESSGPPPPSGNQGTNASLAAFSTPVASAVPQGGPGGGPTPAPVSAPTGGGSPPGAPAGGGGGGGGGGMLTPALTVVGNEVSSVGSSVSSTTGDVGQALPVGPVLRAVGTVATSAVDNLGGGTPPTIVAGVLQQ